MNQKPSHPSSLKLFFYIMSSISILSYSNSSLVARNRISGCRQAFSLSQIQDNELQGTRWFTGVDAKRGRDITDSGEIERADDQFM